jgi:3-dehydroquinate dehydratase-2
MRVLVLDGPNLNLLGTREAALYGHETRASIERTLRAWASDAHALTFVQSNHEGALIDALHAARGEQDGVVINAGAYTHTSVALRDALLAIELPAVEVHLTNVARREPFRHVSYLADVCVGTISGFGALGYRLALEALIDTLNARRAA